MEYLQSVWQISIIALVTGGMISVLAYRLLAPSVKQADKIKTELAEAREELEYTKRTWFPHMENLSWGFYKMISKHFKWQEE